MSTKRAASARDAVHVAADGGAANHVATTAPITTMNQVAEAVCNFTPIDEIQARCVASGLDLNKSSSYRKLLIPKDGNTEWCHTDKKGTPQKFLFANKFLKDLLFGKPDEDADTQNFDNRSEAAMAKQSVRQAYDAVCARVCRPFPPEAPVLDAGTHF